MLDAGSVSAEDYLIDLGSGDGRVVIEAVRQRGARGMGIELDPNLVSTANREAARLGVSARASFVSGNLFNFDFSKATVLTMYLLPNINLDLRPRILRELRPGTRVVSHDFDMGKWKPDLRREVAVPNKSYGPPVSQVYLWYVPADVTGKWHGDCRRGKPPAPLRQRSARRFRNWRDAAIDGGSATVAGVHLRGDTIAFTLTREVGRGRSVRTNSAAASTATGWPAASRRSAGTYVRMAGHAHCARPHENRLVNMEKAMKRVNLVWGACLWLALVLSSGVGGGGARSRRCGLRADAAGRGRRNAAHGEGRRQGFRHRSGFGRWPHGNHRGEEIRRARFRRRSVRRSCCGRATRIALAAGIADRARFHQGEPVRNRSQPGDRDYHLSAAAR